MELLLISYRNSLDRIVIAKHRVGVVCGGKRGKVTNIAKRAFPMWLCSKCSKLKIVEYNHQRTLYRPDLTDILSKRRRKIKDRTWLSLPSIDNAQESNFSVPQQKPKRSYKRKSTTYNKKNYNNTSSTMLKTAKINDIPNKNLTVKKGQVPNSLPKN